MESKMALRQLLTAAAALAGIAKMEKLASKIEIVTLTIATQAHAKIHPATMVYLIMERQTLIAVARIVILVGMEAHV